MGHLRSPLAAVVANARDPDPDDARRAAAAAWHDHGIVLIRLEWLSAEPARRILASLADGVHGPRRRV